MRPQCRLPVALSVGLFFAASAIADEAKPGAGRFLLGGSPGGFVRLDTVTGAASHCSQKDKIWHCEPLPVEDAAIKTRLDALSGQVAKLSTALSALNARAAALGSVDQTVSPAVTAEQEPQRDEAPSFAKQMMVRFFDLVRTLKHGPA